MAALIPAQMPTISPHRDIHHCFEEGRQRSADTDGERRVIIITPDGSFVSVPVPSPEEADQTLLRDVRMVLEQEPVTGLVITAINCTVGIQKKLAHSTNCYSSCPT